MKNYIVYSLLSLLFVTSTAFVATEKWFLYDEKECSILFPKKAETTSQEIDSEVGKLTLKITMYDASANDKEPNLVYGFYSTIYPDSLINSSKTELLEKFFRGAIDGAVENVKGKLLSEKEIKVKEFPGREFRVDYNEGMAIIKMQCILVHNKMYMIQVISTTEKEVNESSTKFFNSFKLK